MFSLDLGITTVYFRLLLRRNVGDEWGLQRYTESIYACIKKEISQYHMKQLLEMEIEILIETVWTFEVGSRVC